MGASVVYVGNLPGDVLEKVWVAAGHEHLQGQLVMRTLFTVMSSKFAQQCPWQLSSSVQPCN
jgi:hypothetical protein